MEDDKLWRILEFAARDLELSHPLLVSLIHSLPSPVNPKPPRHIQRLFLLRHLLSLSASHRLLSPLTLKTLERLLPSPTSPPSPSLCTAYSSHLFYLSTAPGFSLEVAAVLSRLSNYCFAMKLLEPWRRMIAKQEKISNCPVNRVVSARDKAIFALRDFIDEELRAMESPFLLRGVQELCTENQKVASLAPSKKSDEGATQKETEAIQRETSPTKTGNKQVDGTCTPSRRSDRVVTQNSTQVNERETLPTKPGAKQVDGYFTPSKKCDEGANQAETSPAKKGAKQADDTCTSASARASKNGIAGVEQNHICEENQQCPTKSCGNHERKQVRSKENGKETIRNANDASTSTWHANNTNVEMNNRFSHVPGHRFMDRNPTGHVFEWNDSIDDAPIMENAQTGMQSKRTQQLQDQKGQISKRRRVLRWQPHEEEALRKAVKEFGKGNWKEILDNYPDEFTGRSAVDLKDKWRNMTHVVHGLFFRLFHIAQVIYNSSNNPASKF
ncbi:Telomere repeat-binding factor 5 [Carex littledalei]|uniref:Telomere repeat-binding factor 5 n=1 Tax=Carex littledalei TaxID=544730 RepID=A0A833QGY1_9POAL|nr:Telomere repeat-binding factor 5 [Carex littledalei]